MIEFLSMDGYGAYVWTSYALTAIAAGGLVWWALGARATARARLERIQVLSAKDSLHPDDRLARGDAPDAPGTGYSL